MSNTDATPAQDTNIVAQVETLKKAVAETSERYQGIGYAILTVSEVLTGLSALCDVLLTGGDMEAFLVTHRLREASAAPSDATEAADDLG